MYLGLLCGAQVLIRRHKPEKPAFDWNFLRSEPTLHKTKENISAFLLVVICPPITFGAVWTKDNFPYILHF